MYNSTNGGSNRMRGALRRSNESRSNRPSNGCRWWGGSRDEQDRRHDFSTWSQRPRTWTPMNFGWAGNPRQTDKDSIRQQLSISSTWQHIWVIEFASVMIVNHVVYHCQSRSCNWNWIRRRNWSNSQAESLGFWAIWATRVLQPNDRQKCKWCTITMAIIGLRTSHTSTAPHPMICKLVIVSSRSL